jgi:hypothetical protein
MASLLRSRSALQRASVALRTRVVGVRPFAYPPFPLIAIFGRSGPVRRGFVFVRGKVLAEAATPRRTSSRFVATTNATRRVA